MSNNRWTDAIILIGMALLAIWIQSQFGQLTGRQVEAFVAGAYFAMAALSLFIMGAAASNLAFFAFNGMNKDTKELAKYLALGGVVGFLITTQGKLVLSKILLSATAGAIDPTLGFLFVIVLAPIVEEYLFRGALYFSIERFLAGKTASLIAKGGAAIIVSLLFAAWHVVASGGNEVVLQGEIIFSLLMVVLTVVTGSLAPAIGAHFMRNLITGG